MTTPPAAWHPAPDRPGELRYWDGEQWTDQYKPAEAPVAAAAPRDPNTVWEATGKPISGIGAGRFRLTTHYLFFERGTLRTDSQQVPIHQVLDVDVRQSMAQKARGVGTVLVHINRANRVEVVEMADIPNFREGQQAINDAAGNARLALQRQQNTMRYEGGMPAHVPTAEPAIQAAAAPVDFMAQLEQLGKLRDAGVLTEDEFAAKKADILSRI